MEKQMIDISQTDILIVDDTPDNLRVLSSVLGEKGFRIRKALSGEIALQTCKKNVPDLILLDIMMPGMNGYEVCQQMKADPNLCEVPVIFISALDSAVDRIEAFKMGGADYITKPFQSEEVITRVTYQLTIQLQQRRLWEQNAQLKVLNDELVRSNADLEQFAYLAAHDLRSPLQTIILLADMVKSQHHNCLGTEGETDMNAIIAAGMRMKRMIDNLLSYSRVGSCQLVLRATECERVMTEVLGNLQEQITTTGTEVHYQELPTILADNTQLILLFQNLISNGIKFSRAGVTPVINISTKALNEKEWLFQVQDNGIGIESKNFDRIFNIFERLQESSHYPGTGIGMAICKKIVERHGGKIWLESEVGAGTTFYFTLSVD